jgi:hypothetical protein
VQSRLESNIPRGALQYKPLACQNVMQRFYFYHDFTFMVLIIISCQISGFIFQERLLNICLLGEGQEMRSPMVMVVLPEREPWAMLMNM